MGISQGQPKTQSGQIVLITLLVMSVATTVILGAFNRSTVDTAISNQVQESQRAFNAAEAGIENALKPTPTTTGSFTYVNGSASYSVSKTDFGGTNTTYVLPSVTSAGDVATIWMVSHNPLTGAIDWTNYFTGNNFYICWTTDAAVELSVFYKAYGSPASYQVAKKGYDPNSTRAASNHFLTQPNPVRANNCNKFSESKYEVKINTSADLNINNCNGSGCDVPIYMRLRPIYASTRFGVDANGNNLPIQGSRYDSTGNVSTSATTRKISVVQQYPVPPGIADFLIYSNGGTGDFKH